MEELRVLKEMIVITPLEILKIKIKCQMPPIGAAGHRIESTTYKQHIISLSKCFPFSHTLWGGVQRLSWKEELMKGLLSEVTAAVSSSRRGWLFG